MREKITIGAVNPLPGSSREYHTGAWRTLRPVIDTEKCVNCGRCYEFCPDSCVRVEDFPVIDYTYCKGCGICARECHKQAIEMLPEVK
jgi:pyruvate ferredoxin oxidoreductase delta subunit